MLQYFLSSFTQEGPHIPVILDENSTLECVKHFTGNHITSLEECRTGNIENIFFYEKSDEKKHMSILDVRGFMTEVSMQPYGGKALYILNGFDEATPEAMNAVLKVLEEPPEYAIILLVVKNPASIIETIHSRTITLFHSQAQKSVSIEIQEMIRTHFSGTSLDLVQFLHGGKYDEDIALGILVASLRYADKNTISQIEEAIIQVLQVNENPRNILDRVFLCSI